MRKEVLFSLMLTFGLAGGLTVCPVSVKAAVTQQTVKVKGQVVGSGWGTPHWCNS